MRKHGFIAAGLAAVLMAHLVAMALRDRPDLLALRVSQIARPEPGESDPARPAGAPGSTGTRTGMRASPAGRGLVSDNAGRDPRLAPPRCPAGPRHQRPPPTAAVPGAVHVDSHAAAVILQAAIDRLAGGVI